MHLPLNSKTNYSRHKLDLPVSIRTTRRSTTCLFVQQPKLNKFWKLFTLTFDRGWHLVKKKLRLTWINILQLNSLSFSTHNLSSFSALTVTVSSVTFIEVSGIIVNYKTERKDSLSYTVKPPLKYKAVILRNGLLPA